MIPISRAPDLFSSAPAGFPTDLPPITSLPDPDAGVQRGIQGHRDRYPSARSFSSRSKRWRTTTLPTIMSAARSVQSACSRSPDPKDRTIRWHHGFGGWA